MTSTLGKDHLLTTASIGVLAYLSADVAHHAFGHGAACLALGGKINSLSSFFVDCTIRGAGIDLAGPAANLVVGLIALALTAVYRHSRASLKLFILLSAAFNLFWLELQLVFSVATKTDDWAWPIRYYQLPHLGRYALLIVGVLGYWITIRVIGARLELYPSSRAKRIVISAWVAAGAIACITAAFDLHPVTAILQHAAPQSLLLSIGLLFTPSFLNTHTSTNPAQGIGRSRYWITSAAIASALSILFLGPGVAISF